MILQLKPEMLSAYDRMLGVVEHETPYRKGGIGELAFSILGTDRRLINANIFSVHLCAWLLIYLVVVSSVTQGVLHQQRPT